MEAESFRRDVCGTLSTYPSLRFYFRDEGEKRERTRGEKGGGGREEEIKEERKKERTTNLQDFQENVKRNVRSAMLSLTKEIFQTNQSFDSLCSMYLYQMNTINSIRNI